MSGVCGLDINERPRRAVWARIPRFELIVGDTGMPRSWFSQLLQPAPVVMAVDAYPDSSRLVALSRV